MSELTPRLEALGEDLRRAARADLQAADRTGARRWRRAGVALAALVLVPAAAYGARELITTEEVAASLPAGTRMLQGTDPVCEVVQEGVRYRCELTRPPAEPDVADLTGTVEPTVDASRHVNGGCRSLDADGRRWDCFIGRAAIDQRIIGPDFLGEYAPAPASG